jgi:beta-aspartyl-peptidase (threonine type)
MIRPVHGYACLLIALVASPAAADEAAIPGVVLGVHGGTVKKSKMTPAIERHLREGMQRALKAGYAVLKNPDGASLDAVETSIKVLEDDPWFNAGKGAVFTHDGRNELDASIMDGKTKKAGAVAGVTVVKNPISAARAVMEKTKHVLLVSHGAEEFAKEAGLEIVDPGYFRTDDRWEELQEDLRRERDESKSQNVDKKSGAARERRAADPEFSAGRHEWGTVGAVAVDSTGNLAAGTSTGGISNKRHGRVGDSPLVGAGTWADNRACAVSCTGHGEFFIRHAVAHDIAALIEYKELAIQTAADEVIEHKLKQAGGAGASIALDPRGNFAMSYNTDGLCRGYVTADGTITVLLYDK